MKNWYISYPKEVDHLIIIAKTILLDIKNKFGLSKSTFIVSQRGIKDVVIVDHSLLIFGFMLTFVWSCNNNVFVLFWLPNSTDIELQIIDIVLVTQCVDCFDNM